MHCFGIELFVADLLHPSVCEQSAVDKWVKSVCERGELVVHHRRKVVLPQTRAAS